MKVAQTAQTSVHLASSTNVVALVAGSIVGALMLALLKKNVNNEVKAK
mgnify:CR=1 FL=1